MSIMTRWKFTMLVYKWWKLLIAADDESYRMRAASLIAQHLREIEME